MALKDLLKLADEKLADVFNKPSFDPAKARQPFLKSIETTRNQFSSATPMKGRKAFKIANGVVAYSPPVAIEGHPTLYVPSERFNDFLTALKGSVEAGELDKALEAKAVGSGTSKPTGSGRGGAGKVRAPWSAARRAAHEAAQAAKRSAKA